MGEKRIFSLTPRLIAVKTARKREGTGIRASRKTVETVSGSQPSLVTATGRGVNERISIQPAHPIA
jgi:hypothetical protein